MSDSDDNRVVLMDRAQAAVREHFLAWQCRLRQIAMRDAGGRPSEGMRPLLTQAGAEAPVGRIVVVLNKADPYETTKLFQHIVRRTHDPLLRLEDGMKTLQGTYYQKSRDFSDVITALFGPESETARALTAAGAAQLDFAETGQRYRLPCAVAALTPRDPLWQATYWHNALFNPNLPPEPRILAFRPDWAHVQAEPAVGRR